MGDLSTINTLADRRYKSLLIIKNHVYILNKNGVKNIEIHLDKDVEMTMKINDNRLTILVTTPQTRQKTQPAPRRTNEKPKQALTARQAFNQLIQELSQQEKGDNK